MRFGRLPEVAGVLYGVKPVVIAVVVQALWRLGRVAVKTRLLAVVALAATGLTVAGVNELVVLFGAGALLAVGRWGFDRVSGSPRNRSRARPSGSCLGGDGYTFLGGALAALLVFLKAGSVLSGSGYVLLALLRADLVTRYLWLTEAQLLDATAVGQATPGPAFTTATFIGHVLHGPRARWWRRSASSSRPSSSWLRALPPLPGLRRSRVAAAFLDGLNVASLALMVVVGWQPGKAALVDLRTFAIAIVSGVLITRMRVNSAWLVMAGAIVDLAVSRL